MYRLLFLSFFIVACSHSKKENVFRSPENRFPIERMASIQYDTVLLDSIPCSYIGKVHVFKNNLLFMDEKFCYAYLFDQTGRLKERYLGKGHSPREIPVDEITGYNIDKEDNIIIFSDLLYFIYDSTFTLRHSSIVKTEVHSRSQPQSGSNPFIYSWPYDKFIIHGYRSKLYYTAQNKAYSSITESNRFFQESFTILQVDMATGKPEKLVGAYPPVYQKKKLCQVPYCNFDIDPDGNFYISYEADSLIYKFDGNQVNVKTFGWSGRDMDCNYIHLTQQPSVRTIYLKERDTRGYYDQLLHIDPLHWVCRIYKKGQIQPTDGLQIYDNENRLIGDIDIPKDYRMAGYISPFLYLYKLDEDQEKIQCVRLKVYN